MDVLQTIVVATGEVGNAPDAHGGGGEDMGLDPVSQRSEETVGDSPNKDGWKMWQILKQSWESVVSTRDLRMLRQRHGGSSARFAWAFGSRKE